MRAIVIWLITGVAVAAALWIVPGIDLIGSQSSVWLSLAIIAALLALLNNFIRPFLQLVSLPISCLTLGLFALVVNVFMLYIAMWVANGLFNAGFYISSFWSALGASIVISIVTAILNAITGANKRNSNQMRNQ